MSSLLFLTFSKFSPKSKRAKFPNFYNMSISKVFQKCPKSFQECPSQAWVLSFKGSPMFTLTSMVMSSIIIEVIHMYISIAIKLFNNKLDFQEYCIQQLIKANVNSLKCVSITLQSSPRVRSINTCVLATRWAFPCHWTDVYCHWTGTPCHRTDTYCHQIGQEVY